ncbi:MAG TPA: dienelactone hydrolase family protein [Stellaceae bacterium]|nr:dienelactone hydrolase family protein [Stellaceae bacterium]
MDGSHLKSLLPKTNFSRREFVITGITTGFALAVQPVQAQTAITTDTKGLEAGPVEIPVPDGKIPAYRAMPAKGTRFATVLVIHEAFGVHEHVQDLCRRLAKVGYFAVAPALFARQGDPAKVADPANLMKEILSKVPDAQVASDLDATAAWAKSTGKANTAKLGVTGFCWGGRQVWLYAAHNPQLKAGVAWYGILRPVSDVAKIDPLEIVKDLKAPVLGLYGGADPGIPLPKIEEMKAKLKAAKKPSEIVIYPNTPHGFNADYRPSYRKEQADDGWKRLMAWFRKNGVA